MRRPYLSECRPRRFLPTSHIRHDPESSPPRADVACRRCVRRRGGRRAAAAQGQPNTGLGPTLPKSGTIPRDTAYERKVLAQMKAPEGFTLLHFAGPPVAMYPTCVAPAPDGSVFVGVDLEPRAGRGEGRGRVMRLVDTDGDGRADTYTIFAEMDSPRGIVSDGNTVYVMHPPNLTAYRDTNGDGIADTSDDLVKDLGFGLDFRGSDHTTNNITLGPDGWIYVAVGDYGYLNATGKDGKTITRHGGSLVRVRPDGTEPRDRHRRHAQHLRHRARSVRPRLHARQHERRRRLGHAPPLARARREHGLPVALPELPRRSTCPRSPTTARGSGTAGLWIQDPGFPDQWNNTLYTGDWTMQQIFHHPLERKGASWSIKQDEFMTVPRVDRHGDGRPVAPVRGEPRSAACSTTPATRSARSSA